jgi:hypothetical protein
MKCDSGFKQTGEVVAGEQLLFGAELKRIGCGQLAGQIGGHRLCGLASWSEYQDGAKIFGEGFGHEPGPITLDVSGHMVAEAIGVDFLQGDRALIVTDQDGLAAKSLKPFGDILRIGDAAAEKEQLRVRRGKGDGEFVIETAVAVADHLVFIHDEQGGAFTGKQAILLSFKGSDQDGRIKVFREVAGGNPHVPPSRSPLGKLIVCESPSRDGIDGLPSIFALVRPEFENQGFPRAGRRLDDDIFPFPQCRDGLLLPKVRDGDEIEGGQVGQL